MLWGDHAQGRAHCPPTGPERNADGTPGAKRRAFFRAYNHLQHRLSIFVSLPMDKLDRLTLQKRLDEIGKVGDHAGAA